MNRYEVSPGSQIKLSEIDPADKSLWEGEKKEAIDAFKSIRKELIDLQHLMYAEYKHKLLIVFQAMDAGGKDGTIRNAFKGTNPQGVIVSGFRAPTTDELEHDYLWRVHAKTPGKGEIGIFNRSHYEDVLVVRVRNLMPEAIWSKRYQHIINFERLLADEGTIILKFFLYISKEEQKGRFIDRIRNPIKQWKFNPDDLDERNIWDDYMAAYEDAINKTSTDFAPWYVIPSNRKWYRNYIIVKIITEKLKSLKMKYPKPVEDIKKYEKEIK